MFFGKNSTGLKRSIIKVFKTPLTLFFGLQFSVFWPNFENNAFFSNLLKIYIFFVKLIHYILYIIEEMYTNKKYFVEFKKKCNLAVTCYLYLGVWHILIIA